MQLLIFTIVVRVGVLLFVELGEKGAVIVATGLILRFVDIVVILVVDAAQLLGNIGHELVEVSGINSLNCRGLLVVVHGIVIGDVFVILLFPK